MLTIITLAIGCQPTLAVTAGRKPLLRRLLVRGSSGARSHRTVRWHRPRRRRLDTRRDVGRDPEQTAGRPRLGRDGGPTAGRGRHCCAGAQPHRRSKAELETAKRDATASVSLADEACVLADVAAQRSNRKQDLLGRGLASSEDAEQAKGDADAGVASCKARRASASVAQSRISAAAARVTRFETELERSFVRAPFSGRVIDVRRRPGEIVGMEGVLELARIDQMQAIAEVFEADVRRVRVGQRALVRSPALPQDLTGTVTRIRPKVQKLDQIGDDPVARKDGRIVEVEIKLDDGRAAANLTNLQVEVEIGR
ncbi:MAG: efflux RND transporter periplasmic adaptor subunit [Proteobacteria bacterium]|nr:efflux RND transporter periplasmic adaptor subunit [Pseudomonadota bacterium]